MLTIPIKNIPNQAFSIILDDNQYDFTIKDCLGNVAVTIIRNGELIVSNARAVSNKRILQSKYQEIGNFSFLVPNNELLNYTLFGSTQTLIYISQAELTAAREGVFPPPYLTEEDFDPLAPLPLRFAPQGYTVAP